MKKKKKVKEMHSRQKFPSNLQSRIGNKYRLFEKLKTEREQFLQTNFFFMKFNFKRKLVYQIMQFGLFKKKRIRVYMHFNKHTHTRKHTYVINNIDILDLCTDINLANF